MNTTTPTQFEVSFIYDGQRVQAQGALTSEQIKAIDAMRLEGPYGLSVMEVSNVAGQGGAEELVDTITDAICLDEDEDNSAWDRARELAIKIDAAAESCAAPAFLLVEFIWNNGGGDDNLFGQGFMADVAGPENEALVDAFTQALEKAGAENFYDLGVRNGSDPEQYDTIEELAEWISENYEDDQSLASLAAILTPAAPPAPRTVGMR